MIASALSGVPSWNMMSGRSVIVHDLKSSVAGSTDCARNGTHLIVGGGGRQRVEHGVGHHQAGGGERRGRGVEAVDVGLEPVAQRAARDRLGNRLRRQRLDDGADAGRFLGGGGGRDRLLGRRRLLGGGRLGGGRLLLGHLGSTARHRRRHRHRMRRRSSPPRRESPASAGGDRSAFDVTKSSKVAPPVTFGGPPAEM